MDTTEPHYWHRNCTFWTEPQIEVLRQLHTQGLSFSAIAKAINAQFGTQFTRNATIGKGKRLGLAARIEPSWRHFGASEGARKTNRIKTALRKFHGNYSGLQYRELTDLAPEPACDPVAFHDLRVEHCRWPVEGHGLAMRYCGATTLKKCSYCARHKALAYYPPSRGGDGSRANTERRYRHMRMMRNAKAAKAVRA